MSRLLLAFLSGLTVVAAGGSPARAVDSAETMALTGDPQNRIDLVIMAEGYTTAEATRFREHAESLVEGFFAYEPWSDYRGAFNLYRIVTESNESGADHPSQGIYVDTYLGATYDYLGVERLLVVNDALAASVAVDLVPEVDFVVVLVNDELYGGSGGSVATVSATEVAVEILIHELGHTLANLADEYSDALPGVTPDDPEPNVDFDFAFEELKWNVWVDPSTPLPSLFDDALDDYNPVGAYEGARYLETGIYRPAPNCMMRGVSFDFCAVCREALVLTVHDWVELIDARIPSTQTVMVDRLDPTSHPVYFEVTTPEVGDATGLSITWFLGIEEVGSGTSLELSLAELGPASGTHQVFCEVTDRTAWVRNDPLDSLTTVHSWSVQVTGTLPDAGVGADAFVDSVGPQRGCHCRGAAPPSALWAFLLVVVTWLISRLRACRTRKSAWRTRRGPW